MIRTEPTFAQRVPARVLAASLVAALLGLGAMLAESDSDPAAQLRDIPAASRRLLYEKLREFDRLPRDQRAAIVALDQELATLPSEERHRYELVLHRYYVWLQALPADRRAAILGATGAERTELIRKYRAEGQPERSLQAQQVFTESSVLSPITLFESSFLLRIWFQLTPEERKQVDAPKKTDEKIAQLESFAEAKQVVRDYSQLREAYEPLRNLMADMPKNKVIRNLKPQSKLALAIRLADAKYVRNHDAGPIDGDELIRFEEAMPPWFRETLNPLAPDAARRRLAVLYRLVFPEGRMPAQQAAPTAPPKAPAPGNRANPAGPGSNPF